MKKVLMILLHTIVIGVSIALIVLNLFFVEEPDYSRITKSGIILVGYLFAMFGIKRQPKNRNPKRYEGAYKEFLEGAFKEDKGSYNKLLKVTVCYNTNQYKKAQGILDGLLKKCIGTKDYSAVYMFKALCYHDSGDIQQAIASYEKVVQYDVGNSTAWSNVGLLYKETEKYQEAYDAYVNAIRYDESNAYAYSNMATLLIEIPDPQATLAYAFKAIELNSKLTDAMWAAAIAFKLLGDEAGAEKFCRMFGVNGGDAKGLRATLENIEPMNTEENDETEE